MAKIAFITLMAGSPWGGSEYLWAITAEQALSEGHEVFISLYQWSASHPLIENLRKKGARIFPSPLPNEGVLLRVVKRITNKINNHRTQYSKLNFLFQKNPYKEIFDCEPDVICVSQGACFDIYGIPQLQGLLRAKKLPFLVICQQNNDNYFPESEVRSATSKYFAHAACIAFVSQHNLELAERQLAQSLKNALVVQNPVNMKDYSIVPYPCLSTYNFAVIARLEVDNKGQDLLFAALSSPQWRERKWQCNLYGSGYSQPYLEDLSRHYGIADRIKFLGHINDIRSIWADNHLLVLPSRCEGTPLSLIEAMLCGRPAVVTDVGGNTEWIEEAVTGFIAEGTTVKSISAALERGWSARENWECMGIRAHEEASNKMDPYPGKSLLQLTLGLLG